MKLLIASDGSAMTSRVARRFERAAWYVFVDDGKGVLDAVRNETPMDHTRILARAVREDISTVVTDKLGKKTVRHLVSHHLRAAFGRGLTVREVMEKSLRGELHSLTEEELQRQVDESSRPVSMVPLARQVRARREKTVSAAGTPRGQHHLQQYSGRGH